MKKKGELTKERIIEKASRLINKKGIEATSISDLVSAAGIKKGGLYFHFPGKEALMLSVLEKARADFLVFLDSSLTGNTPAERLDNFFNQAILKHRHNRVVGG